jgi:cytochrome c556
MKKLFLALVAVAFAASAVVASPKVEAKTEAKAVKSEAKAVKADAKAVKADAKAVKADAKAVKADATAVKAEAKAADQHGVKVTTSKKAKH